jgi:hypothetical protein
LMNRKSQQPRLSRLNEERASCLQVINQYYKTFLARSIKLWKNNLV